MTGGYCAKCKEHAAYLMPLHGERGGPSCCLTCVGAWHAEHGRKRNRGRVVIRAIKSFLDGGGRVDEIEDLKVVGMSYDLFAFDPLHYLHGTAGLSDETIELTSELLDDALKLTHPDRHSPEHKELAGQVTARLLALKPFVFPELVKRRDAPQPKPHNTSVVVSERDTKELLQYPCPTCASVFFPGDYCDACKREWDRREDEKYERENAKRRAGYARRKVRRAPTVCASCGEKFESKRKDARFCSGTCRQRMHRQRHA